MKNSEGYTDNTAGQAIKNVGKMPYHIQEVYRALERIASLHSLEIIGLKDRKTGKEYYK